MSKEPNGGHSATRILLLVEDNPADADYVQELLDSGRDNYQIVHVPTMAEALDRIDTDDPDVVLLDLRLPDASGTTAVEALRKVAGAIPIVVLTGTDDEELALHCIDMGAEDYVCKNELRADVLRRAIGYAITRRREAQVRALEEMVARYRVLSERSTRITASLAGLGSVRERLPEEFSDLVMRYQLTFQNYVSGGNRERDSMEILVTRLGDAGAGPKDLIDIHVEALDKLLSSHRQGRPIGYVAEGRLLALEMMGLLVDYYRVGNRRLEHRRSDIG